MDRQAADLAALAFLALVLIVGALAIRGSFGL
jgi:hypothetical protein